MIKAVGNNRGIGNNINGKIHRPMEKDLAKELEQFNPMFKEEPVLSENIEAIREMSQTTSIPIALGERLYSRWNFKPILEVGYVMFIQLNLSQAGGLQE